jgi:hypothetical protein
MAAQDKEEHRPPPPLPHFCKHGYTDYVRADNKADKIRVKGYIRFNGYL